MPTLYRPAVVTIRHWLPILTICPVNNLPDLVYVSLTFHGKAFPELYEVRRRVRSLVSRKRMFMEDICAMVHAHFPDAVKVELRLAFDRHVVTTFKEWYDDLPVN